MKLSDFVLPERCWKSLLVMCLKSSFVRPLYLTSQCQLIMGGQPLVIECLWEYEGSREVLGTVLAWEQ